ncbi:hypothetical protein QT970_02360 [Microcoleus sp. herbarium8]
MVTNFDTCANCIKALAKSKTQIQVGRMPLKSLRLLPKKYTQLFQKMKKSLGFCTFQAMQTGAAKELIFSKLLDGASNPFFDDILARIALWQEIEPTIQVKTQPIHRAGVRGVALLFYRQEQPVLKIEYRWWLQESEANLAVFFEAINDRFDVASFFELTPELRFPLTHCALLERLFLNRLYPYTTNFK